MNIIQNDKAEVAVSKKGLIIGTSIPVGVKLDKDNVAKLVNVVTVTPDLAKTYLLSQVKNRTPKRTNVDYLIGELKSGNFDLTGEALKFDFNGNLRDGAHRCTAIMNSGVEADIVVIGGLKPETIDIMDTGATRSIADILEIDGYKEHQTLASVVSLLMRLNSGAFDEKTQLLKSFPNNRQARIYAQDNKEKLKYWIDLALIDYKGVIDNKVIKKTIYISMLIYLSEFNEDKAQEFMYSLCKAELETGQPIEALYRWLQACENPKKDETASALDKIHAYIHAFNCFVEGKSARKHEFYNRGKGKFVKPVLSF